MNKMWVILKREYLTRVKNKTFILMTFLTPLIFALVYGVAIYIAMSDAKNDTVKKVYYTDTQNKLKGQLDTIGKFVFEYVPSAKEAMEAVKNDKVHAFLNISDVDYSKLDSVQWVSKKSLNMMSEENLKSELRNVFYQMNLKEKGLNAKLLDSLKPKLSLQSMEITDSGELKSNESSVKTGIAFFIVFVIYMFIFIYGTMIMRSVMEEKTNRIVEVLVSSVKPFQLMMGKILGVALTGLTQIGLWVIVSGILTTVISGFMGIKTATTGMAANPAVSAQMKQGMEMAKDQSGGMLETIFNLPFGQIIFVFIMFFVFGYLLYSSMFAAVGSAINQETDAQQFIVPVTLPLIFSIIVAQMTILNNPHGTLSKVLSYIPFTSPVIMPMRVTFGVSWTELLISTGLLILAFFGIVWVAGRIYRVGVLMYGKKPTWGQMIKWIFIKD